MDELEIEAMRKENETLKAEQEATKKRLGQAEHVIETLKREKAEKPSENPASAPSAPAAQAVNEDEIVQKVHLRLAETIASESLDESLSSLSEDPEEREEILKEYKASIVKSGFTKSAIRADLAKAAALVRSQQNAKSAAEAAAAAKSAATTPSAGGGSAPTGRKAEDASWKKHLSKADLEYMTRNGWGEEKMKKAALAIATGR